MISPLVLLTLIYTYKIAGKEDKEILSECLIICALYKCRNYKINYLQV
jgi:hypothetical protein